MLKKYFRLVFVLLMTACSVQPQTPTPAPTPSATPFVVPTHVPTIAPTVPVVPPTPTPIPFALRIPAALVGTDTSLYVRAVPDTLSAIDRLVNRDAVWETVGRTADLQWLQVAFADNSTGWIANFNADMLDSLPVTGESQIRPEVVLVAVDAEPLYAENGTDVQARLGILTPLLADGRSTDNDWLHLVDSAGQTGWMLTSSLSELATLDSLSVMAFNPGTDAQNSVVDAPADNVIPDTANTASEATVNGVVQTAAGGLRLRQTPNVDGRVLLNLPANTRLTAQGRTVDNAWLLIEIVEGYSGWVSAQYIDLDVELAAIPPIEDPQPVEYIVPPTPEGGIAAVTSGVGGGAAAVVQGGQALGNRPNIFTTIGDSLTDSSYFLRPIAYGFDLGGYGYLLSTINYFNVDTGQGPAFGRRPISTRAGWSTFSVLETHADLNGICQPGELPIECEYRLTQPAFSIVLIGTNDAPAFPPEQYRANMQRIVQISLDRGVLPLLSTLAPRPEINDRVVAYNQVIFELGRTYGVPVIDLYSALIGLPNQGLEPDGIHLSIPPGAPAATMIFTEDNLRYGTTVRNLTALQALAQVSGLGG